MTAAELIAFLSRLPPETPVVQSHGLGLYCDPVAETSKMHRNDNPREWIRWRDNDGDKRNDTEVVVLR